MWATLLQFLSEKRHGVSELCGGGLQPCWSQSMELQAPAPPRVDRHVYCQWQSGCRVIIAPRRHGGGNYTPAIHPPNIRL